MSFQLSRTITTLCALVALGALAACGGTSSATTVAQAPARTAPGSEPRGAKTATRRPPSGPVTVKTAAGRYGRILVDAQGRTLYLFTRDTSATSRCAGACAQAWPPYLVRAKGRGAGGANSSLVGVARRRDGSQQLTYRGHPLYYYVGDRKAGQILCQDVEEYGGHWWVVSPTGHPVT